MAHVLWRSVSGCVMGRWGGVRCCVREAEEEDGCQCEFLAEGEAQLADDKHGQDACDEVLKRAEADDDHEGLDFVVALPRVRAHPRRREAVPVCFDGPAGEEQHKDKRDAVHGDWRC